MKKTKFFALLTTVLAMGLVACNNGPKSSENKNSSEPAESSLPADSSSEQASSSANGQSSSQAASSSSAADSSQQAQGEMTASGIDIVEEGGKVYAKITGTISGFASADAMKMAFGLVTENGSTYIAGSATPADADYKYVPTVTNDQFEVKVDLSEVQWVGGTYTAMIGPKGAYKAVNNQGGTYGTGKSVVNGFRISVRSHNGTIAADELPAISLTISRMEIEGDQIYHILGGALDTARLTQEAFLAKHPYIVYETTITNSWKQNVMGSSTKTDLVTVSMDESGNALIKTNVTSLPADAYNIKINLNADTPNDTKMDAIIDETEHPVAFGMYDYICYADSTKSDKAHIYGNCGLIIQTANRYVNAGDKIADLQPVKSKDGEIAYEMAAADCDGQNNPTYGSQDAQKNTRLGKGGILSDVWEITGIRSGEYEVYVKGAYSSGNSGAYWSGALQVANTSDTETDTKNGDPYNPDARYKFMIDNDASNKVDCIATTTYADTGLVGSAEGGWTNTAMAKVMIPDGASSFTMVNSNNGYALWIYAIRIVRVGNWARPATEANFTAGVMKVEAESFHESSSDITPTTEDGVTFITPPPTNWPQFNASYKIHFAEAVQVKLRLRFNWTAYAQGNYGVAELTVDGGSKIHNASPDSENLTSANGELTNAWAETESAPFDLAVGEHTIKLQIPYGCTVNWDYFELVIVE